MMSYVNHQKIRSLTVYAVLTVISTTFLINVISAYYSYNLHINSIGLAHLCLLAILASLILTNWIFVVQSMDSWLENSNINLILSLSNFIFTCACLTVVLAESVQTSLFMLLILFSLEYFVNSRINEYFDYVPESKNWHNNICLSLITGLFCLNIWIY
jgi:hypothetical protein